MATGRAAITNGHSHIPSSYNNIYNVAAQKPQTVYIAIYDCPGINKKNGLIDPIITKIYITCYVTYVIMD